MNILGIETSCDETAAAVVRDGQKILSTIVLSSLREHSRYGGIIPEIASRRQIELISLVVKEALLKARIKLPDISAVAVTAKPGLIGSLLVGTSFAKSLSFALKKPLIEVDHIHAHLYANFLIVNDQTKNFATQQSLPAIGLVVSGGHTGIFYIKNFKNMKLLGQTRDDAAGESFDKVARMLHLGYPGGPIIDRLAKEGVNDNIQFSCAQLPGTEDFSFSGIKTAVLYYIKKHRHNEHLPIKKIAYAFQSRVVSVLAEKCLAACQKHKIKTLLVGGGVAANSALRKLLLQKAKEQKINVFLPDLSLCLDNAAMIAGLGYHVMTRKV